MGTKRPWGCGQAGFGLRIATRPTALWATATRCGINSRTYQRYIAARIPAEVIPDDIRLLSVRIDMSKQNEGIRFREIGTHDLDAPSSS